MIALREARILVGVTGGIAAFKAPQLVRELRQAGAEVQVVMTASAAEFVTATTLQAVSGQPVRDTLWDAAAEASMGHIELARWADLILIAPATADRLSRLASGHADDLLGALCLATRAPIALAPAMNHVMWEAPATRRNLATLEADGVHVGQEDDSTQLARRILGSQAIVGISVSTLAELDASQLDDCDYIGCGPIFSTGTKADAKPEGGVALLGAVVSAASIPVVAIGGINAANSRRCFKHGAAGVAVISTITRAPDPAAAARDLADACTHST